MLSTGDEKLHPMTISANMENLTPKQQRFVEEYLVDLNATQAATRAGYSARTANEQGARLLAKASVSEAIEKAKAQRMERVQLTQDEVIDGLRREAKREGPGSSHSARVAAIELLGKHLAMFTDVEVKQKREPVTLTIIEHVISSREEIGQGRGENIIGPRS